MIKDIFSVGEEIGIPHEALIPYGRDIAKISRNFQESLKDKPYGKLVLVTAITPTKAGEGKTTTSIALSEGLGRLKQKALLCLREPALGPVFGLKGGATGGGLASIHPSEEINLHFTGDIHALTSVVDLISAVIDNEIYRNSELNIDPDKVILKRVLDVNDRALREVEVARGTKDGPAHNSGFEITVASEPMALLCLAESADDLLKRIGAMVVAYTRDDRPITVKDLKLTHACMRLLKHALEVNLVQTLEGNPVLVHGGPFANIAHGCNSLLATEMALRLAPITITEAGFGSDLGAEKFLDIVAPLGKLHPDLVVLVATIRALKLHGGVPFSDLSIPNPEALKRGLTNLEVHYENMSKYSLPVILNLNLFASDSEEEIQVMKDWASAHHLEMAVTDSFRNGGEGALELANLVLKNLKEKESHFKPLFENELGIRKRLEILSREIYRADGVIYSEKAEEQLKEIEESRADHYSLCVAKTPASLSDDPKLLGVPKNHYLHVREFIVKHGARFVVPLSGNIVTMPGLPKIPMAKKMEDEPWE